MSPATQFLNCINDNFLIQHVKEPTRFRGSDEPSLIDLIVTDHGQSIDNIVHHPPFGKGDHCVLTWNYLVSEKGNTEEDINPEAPIKWNVEKGDYIQLNSLLAEINWEQTLQDKSLEECVDILCLTTEQPDRRISPPG